MPTIFTRGAASARGFGFGAAAGGPALWSWGGNNGGQLGLGNLTNYSSPKQVGALATWSKVSAGFMGLGFALATTTNGALWSWGTNSFGNLGLGDTGQRNSPVQVGALTGWSQIAGGYRSSLALKT
jgi:alpha-tubulin suppressor-like RCC1 family protein